MGLSNLVQPPSKDIKMRLEETPVAGVTKVIDLDKLRKNFDRYQAKRELCARKPNFINISRFYLLTRYSLFLADDRIIPMLPKALGKVCLVVSCCSTSYFS
jgi:ribosome biogenesis protein UTP30